MYTRLIYFSLLSLVILSRAIGKYHLLDRVTLLFVLFTLIMLGWDSLKEKPFAAADDSSAPSQWGATFYKPRWLFAALLVVGAGLYGYFDTLNSYFVGDDPGVLRTFGKGQTLSSVLGNFLSAQANLWVRPLYDATITWDYTLWGYHPLGYHVSSLLVHLANSFLLFVLLDYWTHRFELALLAALIFCAHPIHPEVVVWISGRCDAICTFFFLTALLGFTLADVRNNWAFLPLAYFSFILALLTKELAILLPLVMLLFDALVLKKLSRETFVRRILMHFPFVLIFLLYMVWRLKVLGHVGGYGGAHFFSLDYLSIKAILVGPFESLLFPLNLARFAPHSLLGILLPVIIALPLYAFAFPRTGLSRLALFALLLIPLGGIPVHNLGYITIRPTLLHSRWFYLSSVGFSVLIAIALTLGLSQRKWLKVTSWTLFLAAYVFILKVNNQPWVMAGEYFQRAASTLSRYVSARGPRQDLNFFLMEMPPTYDGAMLFWGADALASDLLIRHDTPAQVYHVDTYDHYTGRTFHFDSANPLQGLNLGETDFIFRWNSTQSRLVDLTAAVKTGLDCSPSSERSPHPVTPAALRISAIDTSLSVLERGAQNVRVMSRGSTSPPTVLYALSSPMPPCQIVQWKLKLAASPIRPDQPINAEVFWKSESEAYSDLRKAIPLTLKADGQASVYRISLGTEVPWYLGGRITHLGLRFNHAASLHITEARLIYSDDIGPPPAEGSR